MPERHHPKRGSMGYSPRKRARAETPHIKSWSEGDDKPKKYPKAFMSSDCLIITKSDLAPLLPFDVDKAKKEALEINPKLKVFVISALKGTGLIALKEYLIASLQDLRKDHA